MAKNIDSPARTPRLKTSAWAVASSLLIAACPLPSQAAGLGKITVFSALGQPLRAEAEVFASREELAGMRAQLASQETHKQAGVDYSSTLGSINFSIGKRANGQAVIRMSSDRPINDPFVDLMLELNWPSGRLVREYTFLLDPPEYAAKHAPVAAVNKPTAPARTTAESVTPQVETTRQRPSRPAPRQAAEGSAYEVRPGETLGRIANNTRPEGVSLDQMLVAIFRANPDAFDHGNMNRLKAGKILTIPDKTAIEAVPRDEARRAVTAQSADWGGYRRKLASEAAAAPVAEAAPRQQSTGRISARVEDKARPAVEPKDQLKVSKTEVSGAKTTSPGKRTDEDLIAKEKALREANERLAALEKNVAELQKLVELKSRTLAELEKQSGGKPAAAVPTGKPGEEVRPATAHPATPSAPPPVTASTPTPTVAQPPAAAPPQKAVEPPPVPASVAAKTDEKPVDAAAGSKPADLSAKVEDKPLPGKVDEVKPAPPPVSPEAAKPAEKPKPKVVVPTEEPGLMDELFSSTPLLIGGGVLAALGGAYWLARRRRANLEDSAFDSVNTLTPVVSEGLTTNSAFRSAGGQSVDTSHSIMSQADFSQAGPGSIDTDEVDPVAEADVYMAYGRDAQAEEILLEAKQKDPLRHTIHLKLLEIYLGRKDAKPFDLTINELFTATAGSGPDWEKAAALGRQMDPRNPMYITAADAGNKAADEVTLAAAPPPPLPPGRMGDTVTRPGELSRMAEAATAAAASGAAEMDHGDSVKTVVKPVMPAVENFGELSFDLGEATVADTGLNTDRTKTVTADFARSGSGPIDFDLASSLTSADQSSGADFYEPPRLVQDHEVPEVTMLVAPGSMPDSPADENDLDFAFDLTTEFADNHSSVAPTQIATPSAVDEVLDIGAPEQKDLEFEVKLTESTVLGEGLQRSSFDMAAINLDLDETGTTSISNITEIATDVLSPFETEQADTLVSPRAAQIRSGSFAELNDRSETSNSTFVGSAEISASEEVATKLDLAKAYHDMGDHEGARELLLEVLKDGDPEQRDAANVLLISLRE